MHSCPADVRLRFFSGPLPAVDWRRAVPMFQTPGLWSAFLLDERVLIRIALPKSGGPPFRLAVLDPDFRRGEIFTDPDAEPHTPPFMLANPLAYPLGELIMIGLLARGLGLLVHAAGVDDHGEGLLFTGHSGHGKTTMSRLWERDAALLNDDRIVVREREGRFWMYGTPWHGEHTAVRPDGVPISRILILEHGPGNRLRPCDPATAAPEILARSFPPFGDAAGMAFSLELCARLAAAVPVQHLAFVPDAAVLEAVRCGG